MGGLSRPLGSTSGAEAPFLLPGQLLGAQFSLSSRALSHWKATLHFVSDCDALRTGERGPGGASGGQPASPALPSAGGSASLPRSVLRHRAPQA